MKTSCGIIIPTFKDERRLNAFLPALLNEISNLQKYNCIEKAVICIVDDGSPQPFNPPNISLDSNIEVHILRHAINLGQGAALQTGISYLNALPSTDLFITIDADGQHQPKDILGLITKLREDNLDIVFGNRFSNESLSNVPPMRLVLLKLALHFESFLTGVKLSDAHNGFRCFNKAFASSINLRQNRMAHATEFKQFVSRYSYRYGEAPVSIKYTEESLRKGQSNLNSLNILKDLLRVYLFERI